MNKITDQIILDEFLGKPLNLDRLDALSSFGSLYVEDLEPPAFGITEKLSAAWRLREQHINIDVVEQDRYIQKIELVKFYENSSWKPETHYLTPTQQEYRVIRRILEYITEEDDY